MWVFHWGRLVSNQGFVKGLGQCLQSRFGLVTGYSFLASCGGSAKYKTCLKIKRNGKNYAKES